MQVNYVECYDLSKKNLCVVAILPLYKRDHCCLFDSPSPYGRLRLCVRLYLFFSNRERLRDILDDELPRDKQLELN